MRAKKKIEIRNLIKGKENKIRIVLTNNPERNQLKYNSPYVVFMLPGDENL